MMLAPQIPLGDLLREQREAQGLRQVDMARRLGISASMLCDMERGRRTVPLNRLERFRRAFRLSDRQMIEAAVRHWLSTQLPPNYTVEAVAVRLGQRDWKGESECHAIE